MTLEQRQNIISKEVLTAYDIVLLYECPLQTAYLHIRNWKRKITFQGEDLRLDVQGKIHIEDYIKANNLSIERFAPKIYLQGGDL